MRSHARKILHHRSICNIKELEITQEELWHIPAIGYYAAVEAMRKVSTKHETAISRNQCEKLCGVLHLRKKGVDDLFSGEKLYGTHVLIFSLKFLHS